jgi:HSP20 family protein
MPNTTRTQTTGTKGNATDRSARASGGEQQQQKHVEPNRARGVSTQDRQGATHRDAQHEGLHGDRERSVGVTREQDQQREPQRGSAASFPTAGAIGTGSPFAFMRRFAEDMDRLFEDFGFAPLGADPFALLDPSLRHGAGTRSLGSGERESSGRSGARQVATRQSSGIGSVGSWLPQVEVSAKDNALVVRADLPGVKREDVQIELDEGRLILRGSRRQEEEERGDGFFHSERSYGSFSRVIPLPRGVDADACEARYQDGVLEITVPLPKQSSTSRQIEIR